MAPLWLTTSVKLHRCIDLYTENINQLLKLIRLLFIFLHTHLLAVKCFIVWQTDNEEHLIRSILHCEAVAAAAAEAAAAIRSVVCLPTVVIDHQLTDCSPVDSVSEPCSNFVDPHSSAIRVAPHMQHCGMGTRRVDFDTMSSWYYQKQSYWFQNTVWESALTKFHSTVGSAASSSDFFLNLRLNSEHFHAFSRLEMPSCQFMQYYNKYNLSALEVFFTYSSIIIFVCSCSCSSSSSSSSTVQGYIWIFSLVLYKSHK